MMNTLKSRLWNLKVKNSVFEEYLEEKKSKEEIKIDEQLQEPEILHRPLKEFADEHDLKMPTLRKIIPYMEEHGILFERSDSAILIEPFQEKLLLEIIAQFEEDGRKSYPKAIEAIVSHHGLGQGQGQA